MTKTPAGPRGLGAWTDERLERELRAAPALSEGSKTLYMGKLRSLPAAVRYATGGQGPAQAVTIAQAVARPQQTYAALTSYRVRRPSKTRRGAHRWAPLKPHTLLVTVDVVLALFKHVPALRRAVPRGAPAAWAHIAEQTRDGAVGKKYADLEPTQEQRDAYIPFERIVRHRDQLLQQQQQQQQQQQGQERGPTTRRPPPQTRELALLVLALYSMFPPRRSQDWAIAAVLDRREREDARLLAAPDLDERFPNRIVIHAPRASASARRQQLPHPPAASAPPPVMTVTFTRYKTAAKYGEQAFRLPDALAAIVWASLLARPRRYLFQQASDGQPMTNKEFSAFVTRVLKQEFPDVRGSPSIGMLRHSYIVAADVGRLTPRVANELARQMGHSRLQQLAYSYRIDGEDADSGAAVADVAADEVFQMEGPGPRSGKKQQKLETSQIRSPCQVTCAV